MKPNALDTVHRLVAATVRMWFPWVRLLEQPAVSDPTLQLKRFEILDVSCTGYPDCPHDGTDCHFEREYGITCDAAAMGVRMPEDDDG